MKFIEWVDHTGTKYIPLKEALVCFFTAEDSYIWVKYPAMQAFISLNLTKEVLEDYRHQFFLFLSSTDTTTSFDFRGDDEK